MGKRGLTNVQFITIIAIIANLTAVSIASHRFFKEKMGRLTCQSNMESIMEAMQIYHAYYNLGEKDIRAGKRGRVNTDFLLSKEFLMDVPRCPQKGIYKWDSDEELYCTYHGSGEVK